MDPIYQGFERAMELPGKLIETVTTAFWHTDAEHPLNQGCTAVAEQSEQVVNQGCTTTVDDLRVEPEENGVGPEKQAKGDELEVLQTFADAYVF